MKWKRCELRCNWSEANEKTSEKTTVAKKYTWLEESNQKSERWVMRGWPTKENLIQQEKVKWVVLYFILQLQRM